MIVLFPSAILHFSSFSFEIKKFQNFPSDNSKSSASSPSLAKISISFVVLSDRDTSSIFPSISLRPSYIAVGT
jgi:hypothetical protein